MSVTRVVIMTYDVIIARYHSSTLLRMQPIKVKVIISISFNSISYKGFFLRVPWQTFWHHETFNLLVTCSLRLTTHCELSNFEQPDWLRDVAGLADIYVCEPCNYDMPRDDNAISLVTVFPNNILI